MYIALVNLPVLEQYSLPGYIFSHECMSMHASANANTRTTRTCAPRERAHHANMHSGWATNAHAQRTARTGKLELGRATSQETWTQALARQPTQLAWLRMNQPIQTSGRPYINKEQENFGYMSHHNRRVTQYILENVPFAAEAGLYW
jgi:hypothetical protein